MKLKLKTVLTLAIPVAIAIGFFAFLLLWDYPPLRLSSAYSISYIVEGRPHADAQLFQPLGIGSRYYVLIPSPSEPRYHWFAVDFARQVVAEPMLGVTCPCGSPCVHRDQPLGILLTDSKIEDHWQVSVTSNAVQFSNSGMSVSLTRNH